jgi:mono/diheme cytochrome c family protein
MKKFLKILGIAGAVIVVLLLAGFVYFNIAFPDVDLAPDIKVELTADRIERGKYLANHVTVCIDCHSTRDWNKFSGPIVPGTEGKGGDKFGRDIGFPGDIFSKNITPASLNNWTDGEILRAITCGVSKDGNALFPIMPFPDYSKLSKEDLYSIIAYIRTLKPVEGNYPAHDLDFPLNYIVKTMPIKNYSALKEPDRNNAISYGEYLVTVGGCNGCHTQTDKGTPIPGKTLAGGVNYDLPFGVLTSANLTPDTETGIGRWSKDFFISRFKAYALDSAGIKNVERNEFNTIMPWTMYAGMTEEDLGNIYDYLMTVKPVKNQVRIFIPKE